MSDKIFIMNFKNECVGYVERTSNAFIQNYQGKIEEFQMLPPIMKGIAPKLISNEILEYYQMQRLDVWEYLKKSNGFKNSRDIWFMAEPVGEVWVPLVVGMQKYSRYDNWFKINDEIKIQMNAFANVNRHSIDILPHCIIPYLKKASKGRFSTAYGKVYDLREYPSQKGLIGRLFFHFDD